MTGPDPIRIAAFTGYPEVFVTDISTRMREALMWRDGDVKHDHWFDGANWTDGIWVDTGVAEGTIRTRRREDGDWEYYRVPEEFRLQ